MKEFETQILNINPEEIANRLRELGAEEKPEDFQERFVFDINYLDSQLGADEWIRVRRVNNKSTLTYKKRTGTGISDTEEIETKIKDFDNTARILSKLKCFKGVYYQENKRKKFKLNNIKFTLDTWPLIPTFLEIESTSEKKVREGLKLLNLEGKDEGHIGTLQIYKKYGIDLHAHKELKF